MVVDRSALVARVGLLLRGKHGVEERCSPRKGLLLDFKRVWEDGEIGMQIEECMVLSLSLGEDDAVWREEIREGVAAQNCWMSEKIFWFGIP